MIRFASHVIPVGKLFPAAEKRQKFVKVAMGPILPVLLAKLGEASEMLASKLHHQWAENMRAQLKAKGEPLERFRDDGQGGQIDILNTPYSELTPKWQAENKAQAESAIKLVAQNMDSAMDKIEELAAQVHEQWKSRNKWAEEQGSPLAKPYAQLEDVEKEKDRVVIRLAYQVLSQMMNSETEDNAEGDSEETLDDDI